MARTATRNRPAPAPQIAESAAPTATAPEPVASAPNADRHPIHTAAATDAREPSHEPAHATPRVRTRQSHAAMQNNPFDIPLSEIPEGSSYEWKRFSVKGDSADHDPFYLAGMRRQGWEPVDPRRHPNWVPPGYDKPSIIRDGQILMERPIELTNEARQENRKLARQQMREAQERLGMAPKVGGMDTMTRDFDGVRPRIEQQVMRPVSIED